MRRGYAFSQAFARVLAKVLWGLRATGFERVPRTGRLIIAVNHYSRADGPLVGAFLPREVHFAVEIEAFVGPLKWLLRYWNCLPVRRRGADRESLATMLELLDRDKALVILPEGRRSVIGSELRAKPGIGLLVMRTGSPVLPVRVSGTHHLREGLSGLLYLTRHRGELRIDVGEPFRPDLPPGRSEKEAYQAIADQIMDRIRGL
ncbi:MAG: 1-acyl-sn-glycerol-3-phosphate acyltransferase [Calditrichaeota bacterium]|nr:1-acyl-sn-glycerol-3-phosphate acyltransferase [Calditrichota bacterium]